MALLFLGNVITVDEKIKTAKAVLVDNGFITFVGSKKEALKHDKNAKVIDFGTNFIYPSFIEAHAHGYFAGYRSIGQADLSLIIDGYNAYIPVIKKFINDHPEKELYLAAGWNETEGELDHTFLDKIYDKKPLILNTAGGHSCLLSKKAMEIFKIDKDYVKKYDENLVHVDSNGNPTGYICENAAIDFFNSIKVSLDDAKEYILDWQKTAFSKGYTAVCDAGTELLYKDANIAYSELEKEGKLKLRTFAYSLVPDNVSNPKAQIKDIVSLQKKYGNKYFQIIGAKVFLDGVGESRTSWTVKEYSDEKGYYGLQRFSDKKKMVELITEASKNNLSVHAHSEGDGATKFFLDCIKKSQSVTHDMDQRNVCAHLHFVDKSSFDLMAKTRSIPLVAPLWVPKFPGVFENEVKSFGKRKADTAYPVKSFFNRNCKVCYHTDYPISPIMDATRSIYMAKTRDLPEKKTFNMADMSRNKAEGVNRMCSLKALTINPAFELKQENNLGSIKKGKIANMVVMDKNLLRCKIEDLLKTNLLYTIVEGEIVYKKD